MDSEARILSILEQMVVRQDRTETLLETLVVKVDGLEAGQAKLEAGQAKLEAGQAKLEARQAKLEDRQAGLEAGQATIISRLDRIEADLEDLKEYAEITRSGTNQLIEWAERSERLINVPLKPAK